ncbi:MAG: hypothetical protein ACI9MR_000941 [Myxococcota bacterium]|jgi:hypothetical protein
MLCALLALGCAEKGTPTDVVSAVVDSSVQDDADTVPQDSVAVVDTEVETRLRDSGTADTETTDTIEVPLRLLFIGNSYSGAHRS